MPARWSRRALSGRLTELSTAQAPGGLSLAMGLVRDAQQAGEPVAWLSGAGEIFYPPDAAANGIDLASLAVVRLPATAGGVNPGLGTAAEKLARSGGFGLIVIDLHPRGRIPVAVQSRLAQQAQRHDVAILCLSEKPAAAPSIGSLVSLRGHVQHMRRGANRFVCALAVSKDKREGPGWTWEEDFHGPPGLR